MMSKEIKNDFDTPKPFAERSYRLESVSVGETEAVSDRRAWWWGGVGRGWGREKPTTVLLFTVGKRG